MIGRKLCLTALVAALCGAHAESAGAIDCSAEAAALSKDQSELPRLELATPADRPPYCITLETIMAFAGRVKAHVAQCPNSDLAPSLATWDKRRSDYSRLFSQYRCRRTL